MNKKIALILGLSGFVLLLAVAGGLYRTLSEDNTPDTLLAAQATPVPAASTPEEGQNAPEATAEPQPEEGEDEAEEEEPAVQAAPDFTVYDADGNAVNLSDFAGKPIVVNFWASWCGPCKMLSPIVDQIADEANGFKVGKINVDDEPQLAARFNVMSIPTLMVFKNGQVTNTSVGVKPKAAILAML